ncbi:MAG: DUF1080 domain-containing protein, partial [Bryobacterales bacterium]|nr:DUF1080 domain-containing protein [Bryobacteraceae bacterium]MDW8356258.1 DUF1080 domain-containing protein [Bryobacterales bacterium]
MKVHWLKASLSILCGLLLLSAAHGQDNTPPPGFTALFNGKDLTGWQGLMTAPEFPAPEKKKSRSLPGWLVSLSDAERTERQKKADERILPHWKVVDGVITYDGKGDNLQTTKHYGNFELYVDWKIEKNGDSGIYLRGNPQVQIWDGAIHKEGS